jgi:hypothetical protein
MNREEQIRLPVPLQRPLDALGDDAQKFAKIILQQQGRRGGKNKKPDALQQLIISIVRKYPTITVQKLLAILQDRTGPGLIIDGIEDGEILFRDRIGLHEPLKSAQISGLKDRLSRAKKFLRSR